MQAPTEVDVLVVGSGPGGLQWASLLRDTHLQYVVLEKAPHAAPFFRSFPRARHMISHNKCRVGSDGIESAPDFRMRHDWHSLLDAPNGLRLCNVTDEYYPHADDVVQYYERLAESLHVVYNSTVTSIEYARDAAAGTRHRVYTSSGVWRTRHVVLATGLSPIPVPDELQNVSRQWKTGGWYDYGSFPTMSSHVAPWCDNRNVTLIGAGNAAFEVADLLKACASKVEVVARSRPKFAALTHYVGHVRLQKLGLIDRFLLKSLDQYTPLSSAPRLLTTTDVDNVPHVSLTSMVGEGEVGIMCTGFTGRRRGLVDDMDGEAKRKFPATTSFYGVRNVANAWYAGALMHGQDYQLSAGGFIHGFRYLVRAQARYVLQRDFGVAWPTSSLRDEVALVEHATVRIQTSSGLYQMQSVLADVIVRRRAGGYVHIPEVPRAWVDEAVALVFAQLGEAPPAASCQIFFQYGDGSQHFRFDCGGGASGMCDEHAEGDEDLSLFGRHVVKRTIPNFLHPVLDTRIYGRPLLRPDLARREFGAFANGTDDALRVRREKLDRGRRHMGEDFATKWADRGSIERIRDVVLSDCVPALEYAQAELQGNVEDTYGKERDEERRSLAPRQM